MMYDGFLDGVKISRRDLVRISENKSLILGKGGLKWAQHSAWCRMVCRVKERKNFQIF